jgi:hypothetical protein
MDPIVQTVLNAVKAIQDRNSELQDEIARLNEVVAAVSDYADQLSYNGKWANASDEQIEQNRIALELRRILGEIE